MTKQIILAKVDPDQKLAFSALWDKIQMLFGSQITLNVSQMLLSNTQKYYEYLFMDQEILFQTIQSYLNSLQSNALNYKVGHVQPQMKAQKKVQKEQKTRNQMKPQVNSKKLQIKSEMEQQLPDIFHYYNQIKKNILDHKQFCGNFTQQNFQEFTSFFYAYQQLQLIEKKKIKNEVKIYSMKFDKQSLLMQILLTDSALYYTSPQFRLRITQILAIYFFLSKQKINTLLFQILTGQGKSTTIACLAAILTMRGRNVDIITTNSILAKRDVEQKYQFFNLLGIKVSHNIPPQNDKGNQTALKPKTCYQKGTIVYGTPFSYQVDLLFDEYKKKNTRNGRSYDVAIIDQVDSMFIDQKANQTLLSSTFAGFGDLALPMRILYQTIQNHNIVKQEKGNLVLFVQGKEKGQIIKGQMNQVMQVIINQIRQKFKNQIIPWWRQQFIQFSIKDWIWSAIQAAHVYKLDQHYVIQKGKVIPVDYRNTGCLQKNVEWQHGLHQFLQIKNGLQVSIESMTSNYMSNIGHFTRYKSIYGLTGTLGSKQSRRFLQKTYKAQMLQIPPFMARRLKIQPGYFMYSDQQWLRKILQKIQHLMNEKRSVLIICQTIKHAKVIQESLQYYKYKNHQKMYTHLTGEQNHTDQVDIQQIRIATNVAGRGTDLKASKNLIQNGGLHVIITFMPQNLRVQMQARGRAGRNGAPGSSELIVNHLSYFKDIGYPTINFQQFNRSGFENQIQLIRQKFRDELEAQLMENDIRRVEQLKSKDRVFEYFCKTVSKIPDYQQNKAKRDSIEEAWAMFLKKAQYLKLTMEQMQGQAKQLIDRFAKQSDSFYNPSHTVWRGIQQIKNDNLQKAKQHFKNLQSANTTITNKIAGTLMESSINIKLDDKKKKQNYKPNLELMATTLKFIEERKNIVKATHAVTLTQNSQKIMALSQEQNKRQKQNILNSIKQVRMQIQNVQKKVPQKYQILNNQNIKEIQKRNVQKMMNIAEVNVLNSLQDHIKKQINKIANVKADQYAQIKFQPLSSIIDMTQNKQKQTEEALDKLLPQIPYVPVAQIKKIKVPWWKRVLVFAIGALQICLGALIVSASAGAAASFGSFMIYSGFQDCMAALFKPEICDDLGKFFTQKAIQYTLAIATVGVEGISELAKLGKNGFGIIKNSTMSQVLQKAAIGIKQGLVKGGLDWKGLLQKSIFQGLSSQLTKNEMIGQNIQQTFKIMKKPQIKKIIDESVNEQGKLQIKGKEIQLKFENEAQAIIKQIIEEQYFNFVNEISNIKIPPNLIRLVISNTFKASFSEYFGDKQRGQIYKQVLACLSKNLTEKNLAKKIIKDFKIDQLIKTTIKNISKSQDYQLVLKSSWIDMRNQIVDAYNDLMGKYKQEVQNLIQGLNIEKQSLNPDIIPVTQYNQAVANFNKKIQNYNQIQQKYLEFVKQFKKMDQGDNVALYLINRGIIVNGQFDRHNEMLQELHPYTIQVLQKVKSFETGEVEFKQCLQATAYNSFAGIVIKGLIQIIDSSSNSISKLKQISTKLYQNLHKQ